MLTLAQNLQNFAQTCIWKLEVQGGSTCKVELWVLEIRVDRLTECLQLRVHRRAESHSLRLSALSFRPFDVGG